MADAPELEMLRDSARRLAADVAPSKWASSTRDGRSNPALWSVIVGNGWLYAGLPEDKGGFGLGMAEMAVLMEECGRGLIVEPLLANFIGLQLVTALAGEELAGDVVAAVVEGRQKLAFAYAEPGRRFDWREPDTAMRRDGDSSRVDGAKSVVAGAADADLIVTIVRDDAGELCVVLVPAAADGVTVQGYRLIDGSGAGDVGFVRVSLLQEALLARGKTAETAVDLALDVGATMTCAQAIGAMNAAFDLTLDYVKQRVQFGEAIGRNQVLQHRLVDMLRMIKEAEILTAEAVARLDADAVTRGLAVSAAKICLATAARIVGQEAVQMHGAIGTTDEHAISHYFRALMAAGVMFGDIDVHRRRFLDLDRQAGDADTLSTETEEV